MTQLKGFKLVATLVLVFEKYSTFYSSSKAEIIINKSDNDDVFQSIYTTVITSIHKSLVVQTGLLIQTLITLLVFQNKIL